jgi:hypothetical protein
MNLNRRFREGWAKALAGVMVIGAIVAPVYAITADNSQVRDNNANSVIWGGCFTKSECMSNFDNGDGHGHSGANIMGIENSVGVTKNRFQSDQTVDGTVFKDGRVVVARDFGNFKAGAVVATDSWSLGRDKQPGSTPFGGVWKTSNQNVFLSNSIPAFVHFDNGQMTWFVLKSCGNPGSGNAKAAPKPSTSPTPKPSVKPTPKPTPKPPTPSPKPSKPPQPQQTFACQQMVQSRPMPDTDPNLVKFTILPLLTGGIQPTGFIFSFDNGTGTPPEPPVQNPADQPSIERHITSGELTVFGQVETDLGTTPVSRDCSSTVEVTQTMVNVQTPTPTATPQGQVLSTTTTPLPATGPETALGGVAGLTAIGLTGRAYLRSRKNLLGSLRRRR